MTFEKLSQAEELRDRHDALCEKLQDLALMRDRVNDYMFRCVTDEETGETYGWARVLDYIGVGWQPQETLF